MTTIIERNAAQDLVFTFASITHVNATLLRMVALLIGAAIGFGGLAVSFFAHEKATSLKFSHDAGDTSFAKGTLATYSPGLVGLVVGAAIIVCSLYAKTEYSYNGQGSSAQQNRALSREPAASEAAGLTDMKSPEELSSPHR
ncbi:hypothetical protein LNV23_03990 [Paucibacter sp. DJ1R-11]|uniref:hypothetical protein n=1 Tax=Paucibacter sp. DJ1R-11 TaxID=2893556 RepID=UPI0021E3AD99|nr:hypothetical protein [Paucibacter sp. DJ1R-11]MCV2362609.1 hypothetical protein [Paucibacter sp. DJ1R-11]